MKSKIYLNEYTSWLKVWCTCEILSINKENYNIRVLKTNSRFQATGQEFKFSKNSYQKLAYGDLGLAYLTSEWRN